MTVDELKKEKWFPMIKPTNFELNTSDKFNAIIDDIAHIIEHGKLDEHNIYFLIDNERQKLSNSEEDKYVDRLLELIQEKI